MTSPPEVRRPEPLWDANDVAQFLKASRSWVYQRAEDGRLPSVKIGGLLRFVPEVVRNWALGGATSATVLPMKPHGLAR